ncbi:MAG: hypothetical protein H7Y03_00725 [Chitinophagaceae bacterium]|nr:hypothetical protein [Chitinophagaceae bacterium]
MTEKLSINGKDAWVMVEPHILEGEEQGEAHKEYFIAYYTLQEPGLAGGKIFMEEDDRPKLFASPVEALEFATEELLRVLA